MISTDPATPTNDHQERAAEMTTMKAIVYRQYGTPDVLALRDIDRPVPGEDKVLVRVRAASLNALDWHFTTGTPSFMRLMIGLRTPKRHIPGVDLSGTVAAVGSNVTSFKPGDEVFGSGVGSCAEYVVAAEDRIAHKPAGVTFEQAAAVPTAAVTALQGLRDHGKVKPGQKVLINGAAGGVGTFAVQIAKALGADVTAVCSTRNVDMVRSIGADHAIDYTRDDFVAAGQRYDVLIDNVGNRSPSECRRVLTPKGICVIIGGPKQNRLLGPIPHLVWTLGSFVFVSQKAAWFVAEETAERLVHLSELLESRAITPVIDRTYDLRETPEALRYLGTGHSRGKLVITI